MKLAISVLLCLATMLNYLDRLALGVVSVDIRREFMIDERDYGQIIAIFMLAYAVMYAGSGYIVDRLGTKRGFALFVTGWSIAQRRCRTVCFSSGYNSKRDRSWCRCRGGNRALFFPQKISHLGIVLRDRPKRHTQA